MQENHPNQHIYEELKRQGIVENQSEFSKLCGRTPMRFSSIKARRLPLTSDAALTLAYRLRRIAANSLSEDTHEQLFRISDVLLEGANNKVAEKVGQREFFEFGEPLTMQQAPEKALKQQQKDIQVRLKKERLKKQRDRVAATARSLANLQSQTL